MPLWPRNSFNIVNYSQSKVITSIQFSTSKTWNHRRTCDTESNLRQFCVFVLSNFLFYFVISVHCAVMLVSLLVLLCDFLISPLLISPLINQYCVSLHKTAPKGRLKKTPDHQEGWRASSPEPQLLHMYHIPGIIGNITVI